MGDVVDEVKKLGLMSQLQPVHDYMLSSQIDEGSGPGAMSDIAYPSHVSTPVKLRDGGLMDVNEKASRALGVASAAAELTEAGIIGTELRHGERVGRVRLGVAEDEVRLALGDDIDVKGLVST